ncbi:hypothetical protein D2E26_1401 [Bifidobacterium dolichotidis]|uniref:Riboflavin deaminase n=1 Tax=Bifidobacterium dolichotidis TaxID=2306976 RepID=A0A430FKE6_9BIFI|nr:hypothetical protein [Bifidobacterium dolichotidis]RSX53359.1 hypothetical protein D2E26_1401 [Bifidobacterium dolichotidis]
MKHTGVQAFTAHVDELQKRFEIVLREQMAMDVDETSVDDDAAAAGGASVQYQAMRLLQELERMHMGQVPVNSVAPFDGVAAVTGYQEAWGFDMQILRATGLIDDELLALSFTVFGSTHWVDTIVLATLTRDRNLIALVRRWLTRISMVVSSRGLCSWLYGLINDANIACMLKKPSVDMPIMRPMSMQRILSRFHNETEQGYDQSDALQEDLWRYADECHRLGTYIFTTWGIEQPDSAHEYNKLHRDIAIELMTHPNIGLAMMRQDTRVGKYANPDGRYQRIVQYIASLHIEADLDYAHRHNDAVANDLARQNSSQDVADHIAYASLRYVDDGRQFITALQELWDTFMDDAGDVLLALEERNIRPDKPLWHNVVHLEEMACALLGPSVGARLIRAFDNHHQREFDEYIHLLQMRIDAVSQLGLAGTASLLIHRYQTMLTFNDSTRLEFRNAMCEQYRELLFDQACIVLMRLPDTEWTRELAQQLMRSDVPTFDAMLEQLPEADTAIMQEAAALAEQPMPEIVKEVTQ